MEFSFYRTIREKNFEEWIFETEFSKYSDRVILYFQPEMTKVFLLSTNPENENNEVYLNAIFGLFHHQRDYNDYSFEFIYIEHKTKSGNDLNPLKVTSNMYDKSIEIQNKLNS